MEDSEGTEGDKRVGKKTKRRSEVEMRREGKAQR